MGSNKKLEDLEAHAFADMIMTGSCPNCGSGNAHSCEYDPEDPDSSVIECEVAKATDSPVTGHCEACGCLFCTECHNILSGAEAKPLSELAGIVDTHEKNCPELKPQRWAEKYGSTFLLVSVEGDKATIEDCGDVNLENNGERHTIKIGSECGMTPKKLAKHVGEYMKFDLDPIDKEILGVAEIRDDEFEGSDESLMPNNNTSQDSRTEVGISHYTGNEFLKAKTAGLFPGDDFESYEEWLKAHEELVEKIVGLGYKVADVEVRVDEFLKWQKVSKQYDKGAVSSYVAQLLGMGQRILKWYNR